MKITLLHHRDLKDVEHERTLLLGAGLLLIVVTLTIYVYAALLG